MSCPVAVATRVTLEVIAMAISFFSFYLSVLNRGFIKL